MGASSPRTAFLSYWLQPIGHEVVLIEKAPHFRYAEYAFEFLGAWATDCGKRSGSIFYLVLSFFPLRLLEHRVPIEEVRLSDERGRKVGGFLHQYYSPKK